jgi:LipL41-expression chaperone Lep
MIFRHHSPLLLSLLSTLLLSDCLKRGPGEQQCLDNHLHNVQIIAEDPSIPEPLRATILKSILDRNRVRAFVDECVNNRSMDRVHCELKADSLKELQECDKAFPIGQKKPEG